MNVLVTGGAGFIGSHVAQALLARGDGVVVLDDLSNGLRGNVPTGATFIEGDVRDAAAVERALTALPVTAVCHFAGQASTFKSFEAPSWDMDVNGVGTARILEGARRHGLDTVLFASSMTAYGPPPSLPVNEDMPSQPISFYGATKWAAERFCLIAGTQDPDWRPKVVAFRMFNVYGERQSLTNPYQGVLGIFLGRCLRGEPILIFGDGEQSRDFVYAGDVAAAWLAALDADLAAPAVINLGTGTRVSINELWRRSVAACGQDPDGWDVRYDALRPGDQRHMQADISRARDLLGWEPTTPLDEGLDRTVRWARGEV